MIRLPASALASFVCFALGIILTITLGSLQAMWCAAPAAIALFLALAFSLPLQGKLGQINRVVSITGIILTLWIIIRAIYSPVTVFAITDVFLLLSCISAFLCTRVMIGYPRLMNAFLVILGLIVLVNLPLMQMQITDRNFTPVLTRFTNFFPSGFFPHYNECASFALFAALFLGGAAWDISRKPLLKIYLILTAGVAVAEVILSHSRGGLLALVVGGIPLMILGPLFGLRKNSRWKPFFALSLPLVAIGLVFLFIQGIQASQTARGLDSSQSLADNVSRLLFLGLATSCIQGHPVFGGGSHSFQWEVFQHMKTKDYIWSMATPEFVHNELVQAATDYGLPVMVMITVILIGCLSQSGWLLFEKDQKMGDRGLLIGAFAGCLGLLTQSCFSFIFHLLPSTLMLGIALGVMATGFQTSENTSRRAVFLWPALGSIIALGLLAFSIIAGAAFSPLIATRLRFTADSMPTSELARRLADGAKNWPDYQLHLSLGNTYQSAANMSSGEERKKLLTLAQQSYEKAGSMHPQHPEPVVNLANILSQLDNDEQAVKAYDLALQLQGGCEGGFRAGLNKSQHYFRKFQTFNETLHYDDALNALIQARDSLSQANPNEGLLSYGSMDTALYRVHISWVLGPWLTKLGRYEEAENEYKRLSEFPREYGIDYLKASNYQAWGNTLWGHGEQSQALASFEKGLQSLDKAISVPKGTSSDAPQDTRRKLITKIEFLKKAGVQSSEDEP